MSTQNSSAQPLQRAQAAVRAIRRAVPRGSGAAALALTVAAAGFFLCEVNPAAVLHTWYLTRAAGLVAYVLVYLSVAVGLLQSLGMLRGLTAPASNLAVHEHLSLWALYATVFHAVILLWDKYIPFRAPALLLPFASDYEPVEVTLGVLAAYTMVVAIVSTYLRTRLKPLHWRVLHLLSLAGFLFALVHGVALGTDSGHPAVGFLYRFTGLSVGLLASWRLIKGVWSRHADTPG